MAVSKPSAEQLITQNIDVWTSAIKKRGSQGRGSSKKIELYGIKKLRELILELAFSGRLSIFIEENANELLDSISSIKDDLISSKVLKKIKTGGNVESKEVRLSIPNHWVWTRLGDVFDVRDGTHDSPKYQSEGYPLVSSKNIYSGILDLTNVKYISEEDHLNISERSKVDKGDILFAMIGSIGNPVIVDVDPEFSVKNVGLFKYYDLKQSNPEYLQYYLKLAEKWFKEESSGAVQSFVSLGKLRSFPFPLAPLKEQSSIVAKVNELMALCDQLEQQTETSLTAHQTLVEALLNTLLTAAQTSTHSSEGLAKSDKPDKPDKANPKTTVAKESVLTAKNTQSTPVTRGTGFAGNEDALVSNTGDNASSSSFDSAWNRIAQHFDVLFTREHSIDQLKQTILQLAVMGKLVPQDPNDEPASVLLEKIAKEKEQLIKDGKIKKQKPLPAIGDDEKPFDLPSGWEWCNLQNLITIMDAGWSPACPPEPSPSNDIWGVLKTTAVQSMEYREYENKVLAANKEPRPQYEVKVGDILITRAGPKNRVGVSCLVQATRPKLMISDKVIRFHLVEMGMCERYLSLCLNAGATADYLDSTKSGMAESQMNISQDKLKAAPVPLAPAKEQFKIIKRVDELMALCDNLKAHISESQFTQLHLADAMAEQALN